MKQPPKPLKEFDLRAVPKPTPGAGALPPSAPVSDPTGEKKAPPPKKK